MIQVIKTVIAKYVQSFLYLQNGFNPEFKQNLKAPEQLYCTFNYLPKAKIMGWNNLFDFI